MVPAVAQIYGIVKREKKNLGISDMFLMKTCPGGKHVRTDLVPLNGSEIKLTVKAPGQGQQIRIVCQKKKGAQRRTLDALEYLLEQNHVPVRSR